MTGRIAILAILAVALVAGAAMYWLQVYAFYDRPTAVEAGEPRFQTADGEGLHPAYEDYRAIDSTSSPIRFRACYRLRPGTDPSAADPYPEADPLVAPRWFDCFDARAIGAALEAGEAEAYLDTRDVIWGVDRVVAVFPDGRAYAWHQINPCGAVVFDGDPKPEDCPPLPE